MPVKRRSSRPRMEEGSWSPQSANEENTNSALPPPQSPIRSPSVVRRYSYSTIGVTNWVSGSGDAGSCLGLDLGGTLCKMVFFEPNEMHAAAKPFREFMLKREEYGESGVRDAHLSFVSERLGGKFHFVNWASEHIDGAIDVIDVVQSSHPIKVIHSTGGGAHKFASLFRQRHNIKLKQHDELRTVVRGIVFTLLELPDSEFYTFDADKGLGLEDEIGSAQESKRIPFPVQVSHGTRFDIQDVFPLLVVNIGTGVSILRVDSPTEFERVSGTALGGGTYYGLCRILGLCNTFEEALKLAEQGDSTEVNLLVRDIYGHDWVKHGLSGDITAAFFGKATSRKGKKGARYAKELSVGFWERLGIIVVSVFCTYLLFDILTKRIRGIMDLIRLLTLLVIPFTLTIALFFPTLYDQHFREPTYKKEDIARALVVMVAQNVTQIAYLNARLCGSNRVVFTGNFLRQNNIAQYTLSRMMSQWSNGEIKCLYMKHEGYFGAIGSFLYSSQLEYHEKEPLSDASDIDI